MLIFFFKQKTAYEMRISDWSSDVCSSDLVAGLQAADHLAIVELHVARSCQHHGIIERLGAVHDAGAVRVGSHLADAQQHALALGEIGRASCRESVCQYV